MKWARVAAIGILTLPCSLATVWYVLIWIHGGAFRVRLLSNAAFLCSLSILLFVLRRLELHVAVWLCSNIKKWLTFWFLLGLCLPIPLFVVDRFQPFLLGEPVLFTLWPSNIMLLALGMSWNGFLLVMAISMVTNAVVYAAFSGFVWFSIKRLSWANRVSVHLDV